MEEKTKTQIIEECVEQCEKESNRVYSECLESMKKISLQKITEKEVEDVIKYFLYAWGQMARVLGRSEFRGWENKLVNLIRRHSGKIEEFRKKDLLDVDLDKFEGGIKGCYESFEKVLGKVAAVKVLHLLCPDFFPLWDSGIARAISKTRGFSEEDYYRFMQEIQIFVRNHEKVFSDLADHYGRNKLRILDEFLWWITHRQLSLFFEYK